MILAITICPSGKVLLRADDEAATATAFQLLRDRIRAAAEGFARDRNQLALLGAIACGLEERDQIVLRALGFSAFALIVADEEPSDG